MTLKNIKKLVVIAGCQRSGTTLTAQIIGAHPNAFLLDENDGLYRWFHAADDDLQTDGDVFTQMIYKADKKYLENHSRLKITTSGEAVLNSEISHLVLKAPNLTFSFARLANLNIDVSIIYPKRDPRAVVASMSKLTTIDMVGNQCRFIRKNAKLAREFSPELSKIEQDQVPDHIKRALIWRIKTELSQKFIDIGLPTYTFNYEALVSDKRRYCLDFAKHIGLELCPAMENHGAVYQGYGPGHTKRSRSVDAKSTDLWKQTLTETEANEIIEETGYKI